MALKESQALTKSNFKEINQLIVDQLSSHVPLVENISEHILNAGGKRLRPLLVILAGRSLGINNHQLNLLATIIEFLHTSTLLHDDVVDKSSLRRGKITANFKWGNAPTVLVGDFLYARAFQMMVNLHSLPIMDILSKATVKIAEGEVLQLTKIKDLSLSTEQYMEVIYAKTAALFEASTNTAAVLATESIKDINALKNYGRNIGIAFQLMDDFLDYNGDIENLGKNIGDDLAEGKMTLPLILSLKRGTKSQKNIIENSIKNSSTLCIKTMKDILISTESLESTKSLAQDYANKAKNSIKSIPENQFTKSLTALADFAVQRNS